MRKLYTLLLATVLIFVFAVPVFALENIFGGYWRTRAYYEANYSGTDERGPGGAGDINRQLVDTRTRLYYTAKFSDNFKFVNKFEFDTTWGDTKGGDFGADGNTFVVKNSYTDFNLGQTNLKIGIQPITVCRGFLFDDDFAGAVATFNVSKDVAIPVVWMKAFESTTTAGKSRLDDDVDLYAIYPQLKLGKASVAPILAWIHSGDISTWVNEGVNVNLPAGLKKADLYYLGADVDLDAGPASLWFTGIYEGGKVDLAAGGDSDVSAYLLALGGSAGIVHGQAFYISGNKKSYNPAAGDDTDGYFVPNNNGNGWSYDWAPIMGGNGIFDKDWSAGSPGAQPTNVMAANLGVTVKPMPKLSVSGDIWYAKHVKTDAATDEKNLGTEIDLLATYSIFDNMALDVLAGYLFAGDATFDPAVTGKNRDNPMLLGTRLSLSF